MPGPRVLPGPLSTGQSAGRGICCARKTCHGEVAGHITQARSEHKERASKGISAGV